MIKKYGKIFNLIKKKLNIKYKFTTLWIEHDFFL